MFCNLGAMSGGFPINNAQCLKVQTFVLLFPIMALFVCNDALRHSQQFSVISGRLPGFNQPLNKEESVLLNNTTQ